MRRLKKVISFIISFIMVFTSLSFGAINTTVYAENTVVQESSVLKSSQDDEAEKLKESDNYALKSNAEEQPTLSLDKKKIKDYSVIEKTVTFKIKDSEGNVVKEATIEVKDSEEQVITTKEDGIYKLEAGTYAYTIKKDGFQESKGTITVTDANTNRFITLSIDKLTIDKGYVLEATKVGFTDGETVWDVLKREMENRNIKYQASSNSQYGSAYIKSIAGDSELDHGNGSGWMYNVNDWYPNKGVSQYALKDGDVVQLRYTCNLGTDLGADFNNQDKRLKDISIGCGILSPSFAPDTKEYTLNVSSDAKGVIVTTYCS